MSKTKLELTRPGKHTDLQLEPRILIEKPELSNNGVWSENMLIHGDNLLALKALEQEFSGQVKCVYIDPPYNTGNAFEFYEDWFEHTLWLTLMYQRLKMIYNLLDNENWSLFVQLDDAEMHYCKIMLDEIFWRECFRECIAVKTSTPSGVNAVNVKRWERLFKLKEYILFYSKSRWYRFNPMYVKATYNVNYRYEVKKNNDGSYIVTDLKQRFKSPKDLEEFCLKNSDYIYSLEKNNKKAGEKIKKVIDSSKNHNDVIEYTNTQWNNVLIYNWWVFIPLKDRVVNDWWDLSFGTLISDFWDDDVFQSNKTEWGVDFANAKKSEKLLRRILELSTKPWDLVLDSFLWSWSTSAVAHKMGRRWIGIELGDHAYTHAKVRMDKVIEWEQGGISKAVNRQWWGGYKFYELWPSVLIKDQYDNYIINPEFDATMMIQSLCKIENFSYKAFLDNVKHGFSTEKDFIHVTTRHITQDIINDIANDTLKAWETILIVAKTFAHDLTLPDSIQIKKIPPEILGKCNFGATGYDLPITTPQDDHDEYEE